MSFALDGETDGSEKYLLAAELRPHSTGNVVHADAGRGGWRQGDGSGGLVGEQADQSVENEMTSIRARREWQISGREVSAASARWALVWPRLALCSLPASVICALGVLIGSRLGSLAGSQHQTSTTQ